MRWNDNYWSVFQEARKQNKNIPEETCPKIDSIIELLEKLRSDNANLRELGINWHDCAEDLASSGEELLDKYNDLEKENESLKEKISSLENELYQLK